MTTRRPPFPARALVGLVSGYAVVAAAAWFLPYDPLAALPTSAPQAALALPTGWREPAPAGTERVAVVGASETIGFPYGQEVAFARQAEAGLRALGVAVEIVPFGGTALDSPRIAAIARFLIAHAKFHRLVIVLGGNELSGRVFAGREFWPESPLAAAIDVASRARLLFRTAGGEAARDLLATEDAEVQAALLRRVFEARPGRPALTGLPVGARDRAAFTARLARTIDTLVREAQAAGVQVTLAIAPHDVHGSAPYGTVSAALEDPFARRDADPAPLHKTTAIAATIRERAHALGVPCLDLDAALVGAEQVPAPERFLDALHPDAEGHALLAAALAEHLAPRGVPEGWSARLRQQLHAALAVRPDAAQRAAARLQAAWSDVILHLLCGNFEGARPALARIVRELESASEGVRRKNLDDLGAYLLFAVFGGAGRLAEEQPHAARHLAELERALVERRGLAWLAAALGPRVR